MSNPLLADLNEACAWRMPRPPPIIPSFIDPELIALAKKDLESGISNQYLRLLAAGSDGETIINEVEVLIKLDPNFEFVPYDAASFHQGKICVSTSGFALHWIRKSKIISVTPNTSTYSKGYSMDLRFDYEVSER